MDFLDKMKDGITKGIDTIGAKGKELVEETQAHLQIRTLQHQREKAVADLGAMAFSLFQKGALPDEGAKRLCEGIVALDQQIAVKKAELGDDKA